jgi:hypothetical protein
MLAYCSGVSRTALCSWESHYTQGVVSWYSGPCACAVVRVRWCVCVCGGACACACACARARVRVRVRGGQYVLDLFLGSRMHALRPHGPKAVHVGREEKIT